MRGLGIVGAPKKNMKDVVINLQTCMKLLEMPRTQIVKTLIDHICESLGLESEDEEPEDEEPEGHLDLPEA